jgi:hypothetical protein
MKLGYLTVGFFSMAICGCSDKKEENEVVPPGFCKTEAECQPEADRENAQEAKLREERAGQVSMNSISLAGHTNPRKHRTATGVLPTTARDVPPQPANRTRIPFKAKLRIRIIRKEISL